MKRYLERHTPCPDQNDCGSSDAYCVIEDNDGVHGFCFSCNRRFEVEDGYEPKEPVRTANDLPFYDTEQIKTKYRQISPKTLDYIGITKVDGENKIVYPYYSYDSRIPVAQKVRLGKTPDGKKKMVWRGNSENIGLFGHHLFPKGGRRITVTTGENDTAAIIEMMGEFPTVSLSNGDGSVKRLSTEDHEYLNSFDEIIICFDNDTSGREASELFSNIFPTKSKVVELPKGYKDAHQMLEDGEVEKFKKCWWNAQVHRPNNIVFPSDIKDDVLNPPKYDIIPYPWETLNAQIFGLHTPEVITILAEPKVGKSFFTAMIAHHLWKNTGEKVGDISVENTPDERARTLLSLYLQKPLHLTLAGEDIGLDKPTVSKAFDDFFEDRRIALFEKDGLTDPLELIGKINYFIEVIGCRFIIFDHINYLTSYHSDDERKTLDKLSNMLVDIAKDKRINMMIVSHVNDEGKTFGSRNLIKASHTVIRLSRERDHPNPDIRNLTELKVTESRRYGSRIGPPIYLRYKEDNFSWTEVEPELVQEWKSKEELAKE